MVKRAFPLSGDDTALPRGTRVVLTAAVGEHRAGILAVVKDSSGSHYTVETPGGSMLDVDRAHLALERADLLAELGRRQWDERKYRANIVYAAVVGSRAWGLATEESDEDIRGCFVLPFEDHASLYDAPDEIHDDERELACWEIEKLIRQALRADPNTLETLWSPLVKVMEPLGKRLVDERAIFSSMRVVQSFGRYATSQLQKLERAAERARETKRLLDDVAAGKSAAGADPALIRSLFDRGLLRASSVEALKEAVDTVGVDRLAPDEVRPKNAYNLVRLLASCAHWLDRGEPLILIVDGALREELMAIKLGQTPLEQTLRRAHELAAVVEDKARQSAALPESPDLAAADAILRDARRSAARVALAARTAPTGAPPSARMLFARRFFPDPLPRDVDTAAVRRFLELKLEGRNIVVVGLTGAHAYGFPSPDSDLDLKAIHAAPARDFLGLNDAPGPVETVEIFEGREMDLSSHELGMAAQLLLKGNGNMLERLLGPMSLVVTPAGEALAQIARKTLSKRVVHHYRGFLKSKIRASEMTAKRFLYAYRVACTGAHLLLEGKLVTDVRALAPQYGFGAPVEELVERKRSGERSVVDDDVAARFVEDFPKLDRLLNDAVARSPLPDEPGGLDELNALLIEARL